jgi:hypothetical protein
MKKKDTTPVNVPKVTPNPGQIFEEPVQKESETVTVSDESAEVPAPPES